MSLRNLNQSKSRGRICGTSKSGVRGSLIPSTGEHGSAYAYPSLSLPADNDKEICGYITTWPVGLTTFEADEDTSFTATAPDGVYTFEFQISVFGVDVGVPQTATLTFGDGVVTCTIGNAEATGATASIAFNVVIAALVGSAGADGVAATITSGVTIACAVGAASADGLDAQVFQATVISAITGNALAAGSTASILDSTVYARAPSGSGYTPRRSEASSRPMQSSSSRPAAIQRNNR